jgi:hypothetical protein
MTSLEVIDAVKRGELIQFLHEQFANQYDKELESIIIGICKELTADFIEQFAASGIRDNYRNTFFKIKKLFDVILPNVSVPENIVMRATANMFKECKGDLISNQTLNSFSKYAENNPEKIPQILDAAIQLDEFSELFAPTIGAYCRINSDSALNYFRKTFQTHSAKTKNLIFFSISLVQTRDSKFWHGVLEILATIDGDECDDIFASNIMRVLFAIQRQCIELSDSCTEHIEKYLEKASDHSIHCIAEHLCYHWKDTPDKAVDLLLLKIDQVKIQNRGTIDTIDMTCYSMLTGGKKELGLRILEAIISNRNNGISIDDFDSCAHHISGNREILRDIVAAWLLTNSNELCLSSEKLVKRLHLMGDGFVIDEKILSQMSVQTKLLFARKSCGYLFLAPLASASILTTILNSTNDVEFHSEIEELFFEVLAINYLGTIKGFLEKRANEFNQFARGTLENVLTRLNDYMMRLKEVPKLIDLSPSLMHRQAYRQHFSIQMNNAVKTPSKTKSFLDFVHVSTILYGRSSVNYISNDGGKLSRIEIPLKEISTQFEMPRLEILDPSRLNRTLLELKFGRIA